MNAWWLDLAGWMDWLSCRRWLFAGWLVGVGVVAVMVAVNHTRPLVGWLLAVCRSFVVRLFVVVQYVGVSVREINTGRARDRESRVVHKAWTTNKCTTGRR